MKKMHHSIKRAVVIALCAIPCICLLAFLLFNMQLTNISTKQMSNSVTKIEIAQKRLEQAATQNKEATQMYSDFNRAKVDTVAYFLETHASYDNYDALFSTWDLNDYCLMDANNQPIVSSNTMSDDLLQALSETHELVKNQDYYYVSSLSDGRTLYAGRNMQKTLDTLFTQINGTLNLSNIKVGKEGFLILVDDQTGKVLHHENSAFMHQPAKELGIQKHDDLTPYRQKIQGTEYYIVNKSTPYGTLYALTEQKELSSLAFSSSLLSLSILFVAICLLIVYAVVLEKDQHQKEHNPEDYLRLKEHLYVNRYILHKLRNIALIGVIAIFLITMYAQTLADLSRQSEIFNRKLTSIEEILDTNDSSIEHLTAQYSEEYSNRAQNIAFLLQEDPLMIDDNVLETLAKKAQITSIYVFNERGTVDATNTVYKDFGISNSSQNQSYPFWNVIKGYTDVYVQKAGKDDTFMHPYMQYVGVKRMDKKGMVQIGMKPTRLETRLETTELDYVLSNIAVENKGVLFAVNESENNISSSRNKKLLGKPFEQMGLRESALKDGYIGFQTLLDEEYFVMSKQHISTLDTDTLNQDALTKEMSNFIMTAVPLDTLYQGKIETALLISLYALILMLIISCFIVFSKMPYSLTEEGKKHAVSAEQHQKDRFFKLFSRTVQSASSRWDGTNVRWNDKSPEQKFSQIVSYMLFFIVAFLLIYVALPQRYQNVFSILPFIMSKKWEMGLNLFSLSYIAIFALQVIVISTVIRKLLMRSLHHFGTRSETIGRLLNSFIKYASILVLLFYSLTIMGFDSGALLASAGILSLVVGLGAQSLIGDILAGIFIVFEGEFRVGDIVTVGDWCGTVLEIGIRTTKIESMSKNIKIINNSAVSGVVNMTKQYSYASTDVGIEYGESLERVESVLQKELPNIKEHLPAIVTGPFYKGVSMLGDSSVNIRIVAQCLESDRMQLIRDLNREMKLLLDRNDISIPFPQIVINTPVEHEKATRGEKKRAAEFVQEQKELSQNIPIQDGK